MEGEGIGAGNRAGGNRHPAVPRPLRPQFGAIAPSGGGVDTTLPRRAQRIRKGREASSARSANIQPEASTQNLLVAVQLSMDTIATFACPLCPLCPLRPLR